MSEVLENGGGGDGSDKQIINDNEIGLELESESFLTEEIVVKQPPGLEKPEPPLITQITHFSMDLNWKHVKDKLPKAQRFKFCLQEQSHRNKNDWNTIYT